ncbi:oligoribonuclease [Candidatus Fukatsuia anoeciicola]|uniref:oligoribonuclease n=1 Tax=Candidatus Fukatsuia anoeciicola TaxID=2994492 RepID=UPI003464A489
MTKNENHLIWIDLEMTGLDPQKNRIIEIATLVTDANLNVLAEGPELVLHQSSEQLNMMDDWNIKTHTDSGLLSLIRTSKITENQAESQTIIFLEKWVPKGKSPICGNSVGQDRRFLFHYMPILEAYFHYRYLDVSSLKELVSRWQPNILKGLTKKNNHRALEDIYDSIAELAYYREHFIR